MRVEKTVFISYRRKDSAWARSIFQHLRHEGYDVFFDFSGLASGAYGQVILENVRARAHFLALLTPSALERVDEPDDWVRREIETAIESRRNVVPLFIDQFSFDLPSVAAKLTGTLAHLREYTGLSVPQEYFEAAMTRLQREFLNTPIEAVPHPLSAPVQAATTRELTAAAAELERSMRTFRAFQASAGVNPPSAPSMMEHVDRLRDEQRRGDARPFRADGWSPPLASLSPVSRQHDAGGGTGTITVDAPDRYEWTAVSNHWFIQIVSGESGRGRGLVVYAVNAALVPRMGSITIDRQDFFVKQGS